MTSKSSKHGPAIWPRYSGKHILCFDRCQLTTTWMSNIKDICRKPGLVISMATMLCDVSRHRCWDVYKTWTGVHGPPHGPSSWTTPNFQKEIAPVII